MNSMLPCLSLTFICLFLNQGYAGDETEEGLPVRSVGIGNHENLVVTDYPWLAELVDSQVPLISLAQRYPTPRGYQRVDTAKNPYARWLRTIPIRTDRTNVLSYRGRPLARPASAIVMLDVGTRDLQQCADSALRLHAEYLWHRGLGTKAKYHFTSGQLSSFSGWLAGDRFKIAGHRLEKRRGKPRSRAHKTYRQWLTHLFIYAGTQSLRFDSEPVGTRKIEGGDFFVQPGGPGHAVVVLDVAENKSGERIALIGQGFMPAEDFHVLQSSGTVDQVWFHLPRATDEAMSTPSWPTPFRRSHARRFKTPR